MGCFRGSAATAADDADDGQEDASENAEHYGRHGRSEIALIFCAADAIDSAPELTLTRRNPLTIIPGHAAVCDLNTVVVVRRVIVVIGNSRHTLDQHEERHRADYI